jgi:sulfur carrier protein
MVGTARHGDRATIRRMKVRLNGEEREVAAQSTVRDLLHALGRDGVPCAVEVNLELVPHSRHASHALKDGDRVEVVTLVGGG